MRTTWPLYAVVGSGIASALPVDAAPHEGPLTVAQPLLAVVDPILSIWLSVWLFAGHFTDLPAVLAIGPCAFASLTAGVVVLTRTAPQPAGWTQTVLTTS